MIGWDGIDRIVEIEAKIAERVAGSSVLSPQDVMICGLLGV